MKCILCASIAMALAALAGCGHSGPKLVPVSGRITFAGGTWPNAGALYFTPVEAAAGFPMRPGSADFGTDGNFTVTSFKPGDGLVPGRYHIGIQCWSTAPVMGSKTAAKSVISEKYRSPATSGLELEVKPDESSATVQWDVPKP